MYIENITPDISTEIPLEIPVSNIEFSAQCVGIFFRQVYNLLEDHLKTNDPFTMNTLIHTCAPCDYDTYQNHELAITHFFELMTNPRLGISSLVISGTSHFEVINKPRYAWSYFLDDPIVIEYSDFTTYNIAPGKSIEQFTDGDISEILYLPLSAKYLDLFFDPLQFTKFESDLEGAYFEITEGIWNGISGYIVKVPVASIIAVTVGLAPAPATLTVPI